MNNTKPIQTIPPFKRFCITIGELPSSYLETMTYYEMLLWFTKFLGETVVPAINNNAELLKELQDYVVHYFDNLDVQEEINNKLDDMAESGELEEIILSYINTKAVFIFNTIDELKEATNLVNGSYAKTLGFHEKDDGGAALYQLNDTGTPNGKDIILCDNDLLAVLIPDEDNLYPEQFGAYGDGVHNDTEIISYILSNHKQLKFHGKTYFVKELQVPSNKVLIGVSNNNNLYISTVGTIFIGDGSTDGVMLYKDDINESASTIIMKNITLQNYRTGLFVLKCGVSIFENIVSMRNQVGAVFGGRCWSNKFYNCFFSYNTVDGFQCGMPVNHPKTSEVINPDLATFDFFSCAFNNNNRYGANGWMRIFNFYGGFAENNGTAGIRMENGDSSHTSIGNSFIGFDIEQELIGYLFEASGSNTVRANDITIEGGQIALREEENKISSALYFKGNSCQAQYVYNIKVNSRRSVGVANEQYDFYCEVNSGNPTLEIDINTGNLNNAIIRSNSNRYLPNNKYKITDNIIHLQAFGSTYYDYTNNNIVIPAKKSIIFNSGYLRYLNSVSVKGSGAGTIQVRCFGKSVANEYKSTGSATGSLTSENEYTTEITTSVNCNSFVITNTGNSDLTLTEIKITGYMIN